MIRRMRYDTINLVSVVLALGSGVSAVCRSADVVWCRRVTEGQSAGHRQPYNSCPSRDIGQVNRSDRRDPGNVKVRPFRIDSTSTWIKRTAAERRSECSLDIHAATCATVVSFCSLVSIFLSPFNTRIHDPCPDRCLMLKCIHLIIGARHYTPYCRLNSASLHLSECSFLFLEILFGHFCPLERNAYWSSV